MNKQAKRQFKPVKAWAVFKNGRVKREDFFTKDFMRGKASFAVFPRTRNHPDLEPIPNPLWGYAVGQELVIPVLIQPLPTPKETKKGRKKKS